MITQSYRLMTAKPNASKPLGCSNELTKHDTGLEWLGLAVMCRYASVTMHRSSQGLPTPADGPCEVVMG